MHQQWLIAGSVCAAGTTDKADEYGYGLNDGIFLSWGCWCKKNLKIARNFQLQSHWTTSVCNQVTIKPCGFVLRGLFLKIMACFCVHSLHICVIDNVHYLVVHLNTPQPWLPHFRCHWSTLENEKRQFWSNFSVIVTYQQHDFKTWSQRFCVKTKLDENTALAL